MSDWRLARLRGLADEMREHCVAGADALLSDLAYNLVEDSGRVWAGSFGEFCKMTVFGGLQDVLIDKMSVNPHPLAACTAYLIGFTKEKSGELDGAEFFRHGFAG